MFNVIPLVNNKKSSLIPQQNSRHFPQKNALSPLNRDIVSFCAVEKIPFEKTFGKFFDSAMYVSENKLSRALARAKSNSYMHILADEISEVLAKRLDANEIVKNAKGGSFSFAPHTKFNPGSLPQNEYLMTFYSGKDLKNKYVVDWTELHNKIREVLESTGAKSTMMPTVYKFKSAKENLYNVLTDFNLLK